MFDLTTYQDRSDSVARGVTSNWIHCYSHSAMLLSFLVDDFGDVVERNTTEALVAFCHWHLSGE
jgi:hypothetical protein